MTSKELEARIHDAKILKEGDNISAVINNDEVAIRKYGANNETDSKIDSVFLAKEVMAADQSINKVTVYFYDPRDRTKYSEVVVHIPIIKIFASGKMSKEDLLASLDLVHKRDLPVQTSPAIAPETTPPVDKSAVQDDSQNSPHQLEAIAFDDSISYGQFESVMKDCLRRIQTLSAASQNVDSYIGRYHAVEQSIKTGHISNTKVLLDGLTSGLKDQENALARKRLAKPPINLAAPKQLATEGRVHAALYHSAKDDDMVLWISPQATAVWDKMEKLYPYLMPEAGPLKLERDYISDTLVERKKHGYDISRYVPVVAKLNRYARTPKIDPATMSAQVQYAYSLLGISRRGLVQWMLRWQEKVQE